MSAGLLIVTHEGIGGALLRTASNTLGACPMHVAVLEVAQDNELDAHRERAARMASDLDSGDGVLVLTDLFGATPGNIAGDLHDGRRVITVTGVNLPMLMRVLNYCELPLADLAAKAVSGGRDCVFTCGTDDDDGKD